MELVDKSDSSNSFLRFAKMWARSRIKRIFKEKFFRCLQYQSISKEMSSLIHLCLKLHPKLIKIYYFLNQLYSLLLNFWWFYEMKVHSRNTINPRNGNDSWYFIIWLIQIFFVIFILLFIDNFDDFNIELNFEAVPLDIFFIFVLEYSSLSCKQLLQ